MLTDSDSFYSSAPVRRLFAQEMAALTPILGGVYGNAGLILRAHGAAPAALPRHLLGTIIDLTLSGSQSLHGPLCCAPDELPLLSESCKLVIAQHVFERLDEPQNAVAEFARVLAPEGVGLILGFNPLSVWRPWLAVKSRAAAVALRPRSAHSCEQILRAQGIETLQTRFLGSALPWQGDADAASPTWRSPLLGPLAGAWLLLTRKRRSALTPLRMRSRTRELAINPRLVTGAHRECA